MTRKFRPLEESIKIVMKCLNQEVNGYEYDPDPVAVEYWTRRLHGYQKLLAQKQNTGVRGNPQ